MRGLLTFIAIAGIAGGLFLWQKHNEPKTAATGEEISAKSTPAPRQTYEHDWAKHSLDTTHSVIDQIQRQRKDDDLNDAVGRR
jgi:Flp pilus assembly protein TadB